MLLLKIIKEIAVSIIRPKHRNMHMRKILPKTIATMFLISGLCKYLAENRLRNRARMFKVIIKMDYIHKINNI